MSEKVCGLCGRKDFIYGLLSAAALSASGAQSKVLGDFFSALPAPTPADQIPDKKDAVKVRLVFSIWDEVQVRKTWPNVGFDFRPVMKNVTDALNAAVKDVEFIPGQAYDEKTAGKILREDAARGGIKGYLVLQMNTAPRALPTIATAGKPVLYSSFPYCGVGGWVQQNAMMIRRQQRHYAFMASLDFNDTIGAAQGFRC